MSIAVIEALLEEASVIEIMVNPSGDLFVERFGQEIVREGHLEPQVAAALIRRMATSQDQEANAYNPIVSAEIGSGGHRFEGLLPPIVASPAFAIRRRASQVFTLESYVERGSLSAAWRDEIVEMVKARRNIIVAGSTGSGKTTFLNALLAEVGSQTPEVRQIIVEDTVEIQTSVPNTMFIKANADTSMQRCLMSALRLRPDRIHVGEVRDGAALTLLKAWNTGHPGGFASIHANSAESALIRLAQLVSEVSAQPQDAVIQAAVDAVIFLRRGTKGPTVSQLLVLCEDLNLKGE